MKGKLSHLRRMLRTGKSKWVKKTSRLEILKHQLLIELESQKTLLAISLAGIGYNMFLLTGETYHSRIIHIFSGLAIFMLLLTCLNIFYGLKIVPQRLGEMIDEEIINDEKDPKLEDIAKQMPRIIYWFFISGFAFTLTSIFLIGIFTLPKNWL